jgi:lipopolysaccharide transport system permease protein
MTTELVSATGETVADVSRSVVDVPLFVREPTSGWRALNLLDLWRNRELLYFLAWRDIKIRYKQTVLGASWAILQPLLNMVIFTVLFGRLAGL